MTGDLDGRRLVMRADAGGALGSGHVMRCLALAQAWRARGGAAQLVSADLPERLAARAAAAGVDVLAVPGERASLADAAALRAIAAGADGLVVDGYTFSSAYLAACAGAAPLLVVDDVAALERYDADIILNQNAHARPALYAGRSGSARLLLGGAYALLRPEFRDLDRNGARVGVLATFGGVDPYGVSELFLDACAMAPCDATLIVGPANERSSEIARRAGDVGVAIATDVADMAQRLARAALVVTAGGSTLWEGCAAGAPMLVTAVVPEEEVSAADLAAAGACRYLGPRAALTASDLAAAVTALLAAPDERAALARAASALVDGRGADRVIDALRATGNTLFTNGR